MIDNISRRAAIDAINYICPVDTEYDCTLLDRADVRCVLSDLPSTDRTGHWIDTYGDEWVCSNCGVATYASEDYYSDDVRAYKMNFCHYCGADMRGGQDDQR